MLDVYSFSCLNGKEGKEVVCFRISDQLFYFDKDRYNLLKYAYYLMALGYTLENVCDILGVLIDTIDVNDKNLKSVVGCKLAANVRKKWNEDFVDEDSGEVVTIERAEIFIEAGEYITEDNLELIKESGTQKLYVYHDSQQDNYTALVADFVEPDVDEWKCLHYELYEQDKKAALLAVIKDLFPSKNPEDVTEKEKDDLAYNIVTVIKGMYDYQYSLSDVILPFKYKDDDVHTEMTDEEQRLYGLIIEFYNEMIKKVEKCETDLEVMKVFKNNSEIQFELCSFLKENGVSPHMIKVLVENIFLDLK